MKTNQALEQLNTEQGLDSQAKDLVLQSEEGVGEDGQAQRDEVTA